MKYFMGSLKAFTVNPLRMHNPEALHFSNPPSSKRIGERRTHTPYTPQPFWSSSVLCKCFTSAPLAPAVFLLWYFGLSGRWRTA